MEYINLIKLKIIFKLMLFVLFLHSFSLTAYNKSEKRSDDSNIYKQIEGTWQYDTNELSDNLGNHFKFHSDSSFTFYEWNDDMISNIDTISGKFIIKNDSIYFRIDSIAEIIPLRIFSSTNIETVGDWVTDGISDVSRYFDNEWTGCPFRFIRKPKDSDDYVIVIGKSRYYRLMN